MFENFEVVTCGKVREGEERVVKVHDGNAEGRHAIIVDDLVHSGGTMLKCAEALREQGATSVSMYVTHAILECDAWQKFLDANIRHFWISDSNPDMAALLQDKAPFEVLSIAPLVAQLVEEIDQSWDHIG